MKATNNIRVQFNFTKDGEICGAMNQIWHKNELTDFLLNVEGEIKVSRNEPNVINIVMDDEDFHKTCKNFSNADNL